MPKEVIIIGAGLGGLATAIRLAARGINVTICEQSGTVGGKMNRWICDGYTFDTGPSLITMPWVFDELFRIAGSRLEEQVTLVQMEPLSKYYFDDGVQLTYSQNLPSWIGSVQELEPRDVNGYFGLMKIGSRLFELSRNSFLSRPALSRPRREDLASLRHFPFRGGWGNYARVVERHLRSPHLRQFFNRYPTYVGSSPFLSPSTLLIIPYIEQAFGGWYVLGGLYRIVETLAELATRLGVTLATGARVEAIEHSGRQVKGVRLADGRRLKADIVVANCEAEDAAIMLGERGSVRLEQADRSMSGLVFLIGVRRTLPELQHHQVYFSADYQGEFSQIFCEGKFPDDPTVYVNCASRNDRSLVPGEGETLFIMTNAPANDRLAWDKGEVDEAQARVFRRLTKCGFPAIHSEMAVIDVWTPRRLADRYLMPGGAIYGSHSHGWRRALLRPANRHPRYQGMYFVGGSSHPGGGTPTVILSSRITADLIQKHEFS